MGAGSCYPAIVQSESRGCRLQSCEILTGRQQFEVVEGISQSLAGRTALLKLLPFSIAEVAGRDEVATLDRMVVTGFYPRIYDFKGLDHFARLFPDLPHGGGLIYGGDVVQERAGVRVYPVQGIHELLDRVNGEVGGR